MNLFQEINYKATAKNTEHFLTYWLPKLILKSGRQLTDLSSPKLSYANTHSNYGNVAENKLVNGMDAEVVIQAIHRTIYGCPILSRKILVSLYIKHASSQSLIASLPYERAYFFKVLKPQALNCFADGYDFWQCKLNVDMSDRQDLHIYMDNAKVDY